MIEGGPVKPKIKIYVVKFSGLIMKKFCHDPLANMINKEVYLSHFYFSPIFPILIPELKK